VDRLLLKSFIRYSTIIAAFMAVVSSFILFKDIGLPPFWGVNSTYVYIIIGVIASLYAAFLSVYLTRLRERRLRQQRIFIIYTYKDRNKVCEIVHKLRDMGFNPWFDVDEITPGQIWEQAVMKGIIESAIALLFLSENLSIKDGMVSKEFEMAMSTMMSRDESFSPIIPIRLDDAPVPEQVSDIHWVDIREGNGYEQLKKGLNRVLGQT